MFNHNYGLRGTVKGISLCRLRLSVMCESSQFSHLERNDSLEYGAQWSHTRLLHRGAHVERKCAAPDAADGTNYHRVRRSRCRFTSIHDASADYPTSARPSRATKFMQHAFLPGRLFALCRASVTCRRMAGIADFAKGAGQRAGRTALCPPRGDTVIDGVLEIGLFCQSTCRFLKTRSKI